MVQIEKEKVKEKEANGSFWLQAPREVIGNWNRSLEAADHLKRNAPPKLFITLNLS